MNFPKYVDLYRKNLCLLKKSITFVKQLKINTMKTSLRERMENMLCRIVGRIEMLQKSINEYKEAGDFENAMKCDIKMRTFKLIEEDLRKELWT